MRSRPGGPTRAGSRRRRKNDGGAVIRQRKKTRITIHLDEDVLEAFRDAASAENVREEDD